MFYLLKIVTLLIFLLMRQLGYNIKPGVRLVALCVVLFLLNYVMKSDLLIIWLRGMMMELLL